MMDILRFFVKTLQILDKDGNGDDNDDDDDDKDDSENCIDNTYDDLTRQLFKLWLPIMCFCFCFLFFLMLKHAKFRQKALV